MRIARLGPVIVIFGAREYFAPVPLRFFPISGRRFAGVVYRIAPHPQGGETWIADEIGAADLREITVVLSSAGIAEQGSPTVLDVNEADFARLSTLARAPRRGVLG